MTNTPVIRLRNKLLLQSFYDIDPSDRYYKHFMIVIDNSRVIRMMLQIVASPMIIILMTLEAPTNVIQTTLENIYSTGVTYDHHLGSSLMILTYNHHLWSSLMIVTYDHHLQSSLMIVNYDHHDRHLRSSWSSLTIVTYDCVAHASDFSLWNFQTVGLYIYALEGLECQG